MTGDWPVNITPIYIFIKGTAAVTCNSPSIANYRPVSLTSVICKVMESIIEVSLMKDLAINKLITDAQFVFVPFRSILRTGIQICSYRIL